MSFLSGLLRTVAPLALAAFTGGASLAIQTALRQIITQVLQQVLQKLGDQMGLPQSMIGLAQGALSASTGNLNGAQRSISEIVQDFGQQSGASTVEMAATERLIQDQSNQITENIKRAMGGIGGLEGKEKATKGARGQSWLQVLANSMTKVLDASLAKMDQKSTELANIQREGGNIKSTDRSGAANNAAMSTKAQQDFNVSVQEFNIIANSINNSIKTIGEALSAMARKQ
jgi:hypothetical protein